MAFVEVVLLLPEALCVMVTPSFSPRPLTTELSPRSEIKLSPVLPVPSHSLIGPSVLPESLTSVCVSLLYFPAGFELLYQPEVVRLYLSLRTESQNYNTLEAAAGALQNLSAGQWTVSSGSGRIRRPDTVCCLTFRFLYSHILPTSVLIIDLSGAD